MRRLLLLVMLVWAGAILAQESDLLADELVLVRELEGHTMPVTGLAFHPELDWLASSADDTSVRLWDVTTGEQIEELYEHTTFVKDVAFSENRMATSSWDRTVVLMTVTEAGAEFEARLSNALAVVEPLAFSPDGSSLAFGIGDGTVPLIELDMATEETVEARRIFQSEDSLEIVDLAFSPDGELLAVANGFPSETVQIWATDDDSEEPFALVEGHSVMALAFWPGESGSSYHLATAGDDGTLRLWEVTETDATETAAFELADWLTALAFSPSGDVLAVGDIDGEVYLLDATDPEAIEQVSRLVAHDEPVNALAFNPQETLLATGGADDVIRLWGPE